MLCAKSGQRWRPAEAVRIGVILGGRGLALPSFGSMAGRSPHEYRMSERLARSCRLVRRVDYSMIRRRMALTTASVRSFTSRRRKTRSTWVFTVASESPSARAIERFE